MRGGSPPDVFSHAALLERLRLALLDLGEAAIG